jgi:predicted acetyltransferase
LSSELEYLIPTLEESRELTMMLGQALHFPNPTAADMEAWVERVGHEDFRYTRLNGRMACGLRIIWMGQWFGGARVPAAGITVVGAAPEYRGKGATSWLMRKMHEEVRERGCPISVLFPATLTFYRSVGYERSGAWNSYELDLDRVEVKSRELDVRPIPVGDYSDVERLYNRRAVLTNGMLDRPQLMWKRTHEPKDKIAYRYLLGRNGEAEGYVTFTQGGQFEPIKITDHCVLTREAGLRLLGLLADHRTLATKAEWCGGPNDPLLYLLPEQKVKPTGRLDWVVRITDVQHALTARAYPAGLSTKIDLEVDDDQLPWNQGRFILEISDGHCEVRPGGEGSLRLNARTLAPLYTGYYSPQELKGMGILEGDDRALASAQLAFSGARPWMEDIF